MLIIHHNDADDQCYMSLYLGSGANVSVIMKAYSEVIYVDPLWVYA